MKSRLVEANADRVGNVERGETTVVGVNKYVETEPSPLMGEDGGIMVVDSGVEKEQVDRLNAWRAAATPRRCGPRLPRCARPPQHGPKHHACLDRLRQGGRDHRRMGRRDARRARRIPRPDRRVSGKATRPKGWKTCVRRWTRCRIGWATTEIPLVGKPGLDGHSNGAEQIAFRARDCGMDIDYEGIRLTPEQIVRPPATARM